MVSLKEALKLTKLQIGDIVFLTNYDSKREFQLFTQVFTVKEILEKFDIKHTFVTETSPHFLYGEYQGLLFTIIKRRFRKDE